MGPAGFREPRSLHRVMLFELFRRSGATLERACSKKRAKMLETTRRSSLFEAPEARKCSRELAFRASSKRQSSKLLEKARRSEPQTSRILQETSCSSVFAVRASSALWSSKGFENTRCSKPLNSKTLELLHCSSPFGAPEIKHNPRRSGRFEALSKPLTSKRLSLKRLR